MTDNAILDEASVRSLFSIGRFAGWMAAALCILSIFAVGQFRSTAQSCLTPAQARSIAQEISSELQRRASTNMITVETLAAGIRELNTVGSQFEISQNGTEYCKNLERLKIRLLAPP